LEEHRAAEETEGRKEIELRSLKASVSDRHIENISRIKVAMTARR
jgi:hypothetical protein